MELLSLNSPSPSTNSISSLSAFLPRPRGRTYLSSSLFGQAVPQHQKQPLTTVSTNNVDYHSNCRNYLNAKHAATASLNTSRLPPAATANVSAQVATDSTVKTGQQEMSTDSNLVFVAGATGRVGSRTVRELLKFGFRVRAGVRSTQRAEKLVKSVHQMKIDGANAGIQPMDMLEIVECDLENESSIGPAIGKASVVICCIGASEKEVFDITGPYRIDYRATKNLIEAATIAQVDHFILLTSLGTNKFGFPAAILNLFWGVLIWKRKAEEALIASGLPYTIVRPGGMERPTDSYKETHNTVLANEDTYFGGQVSNLQVAELMAFMAKHKRLSFCKVVEVIAETTAPLTPFEESLALIPPQRELPPEPTPDLVPDTQSRDTDVPKARPLSPFTMYDDLKPPTSPCPPKTVDPVQPKLESSTSAAQKEPEMTSTQEISCLSPYMAYEDLKPPISPTPTPSSSSPLSPLSPLSKSDAGNNVGGNRPANANDKELVQNSSHQSPSNVYDDVEPPTSPCLTTPDSSTSGELKAQKTKHLSPYSMYEDLKPPSSPSPSVPKY